MVKIWKPAFIVSFFLYLIFTGCIPNNSELYEKVIKIETLSVNKTENHHFFILVENNNSTPVFKEIQNYSGYTFIRNGKINGDEVNIHVFSVNTFGGIPSYIIRSFFSVPVGGIAVFGEDNILNQKNATSRVDLTFENIPDYDVVSRSVYMQRQCNTLASFFDVSSEPTGTCTFPANETFYSCFQKGNEASYILKKVETLESSFTIVFDSVKTEMNHYSLPKKMGNSDIKQISVMAYDAEINAIELFDLSDISIFTGESIDLFIPQNDLNISHFLIKYSSFTGTSNYCNLFSSETIITTPEIINAEITTPSEIDTNLEISASGEIDFLSVKNNFEGSSWIVYGKGNEDLYYPEIPDELKKTLGNPDFITNSGSVNITVFDYSELNGYEDALEFLLDDSMELMDGTGLNYKSLSKTVSFQ